MEEFDFTKVIVRLSAILRIFWKDMLLLGLRTEPHILKLKWRLYRQRMLPRNDFMVTDSGL